MTKLKFIKFFYSEPNEVITYFTAEKVAPRTGQTHEFTSGEDAQARSTTEAYIFWNDEPIGVGAITE